MQNRNGWLQGIQYFRAIAIIEVITFHVVTDGAAVPNPLWMVVALWAFTNFGVIHFIFISGVVLYNRYNNGFSLSTFYKKRFNAVVPPYLIWSTFYFAFFYVVLPLVGTYLFHRLTNQSVATLVSTYLLQLTVGYAHLFFIVILLVLYLLYPLLEKMYNRAVSQSSPIYILSFLLLVSIAYSLLVATFPPYQISNRNTLYIGVYLGVLYYVFFFVFGFFIAQHYQAIKKRVANFSLKGISFVVLASTIYYAVVLHAAIYDVISSPTLSSYTWLSVVTGPFYCLLLILFYLRISTTWGRPRGFFLSHLERIGEDSFGIFLVHWFFVWTFRAMLLRLGLSFYNPLLYPVLFLLTIIPSYLMVEAIYRLPFSNIMIGARRKKQASPTREHSATQPAATEPIDPSDRT